MVHQSRSGRKTHELRYIRLYDILDSRRVTEEVLGATLCLVEQALISRPNTSVSTVSRELEALTPNHFLLAQHDTSFPSLLPGEHFDHKKMYVKAQSYADAIWSCWLREYVPSLNKPVSWHTCSDFTLETGDLEWVFEPNSQLAPVLLSSGGTMLRRK